MVTTIATAANADIVFMLDKKAAHGNGHIAVLIGSEAAGWHYVSINGTAGAAKPWGASVNADTGALVVDYNGTKISNLRRAIRQSCVINPNEKHNYLFFRRIKTARSEDIEILKEIKQTASSLLYGIIGPGKSCIDVAQTAFATLVKSRKLDNNGSIPGQSDLIPKNWFRKLDNRIREVNRHCKNRYIAIKFYHRTNKTGRTFLTKNINKTQFEKKTFLINYLKRKTNILSLQQISDVDE
ncbi:MAG: hypothetical protein K6F33_06310 [Bacteroidales bacterium]|nr:hypothetical protein [Bacteroidales bacterium]